MEKDGVPEVDGEEVTVSALAVNAADRETVKLLENEAVTDADGEFDTVQDGVAVAKEADALADKRAERLALTSGEAESSPVAEEDELVKGVADSLTLADGEVEGDAEVDGGTDADGVTDVDSEAAEEGETDAVMDGSSVAVRAMLSLGVSVRQADSDGESVACGLSDWAPDSVGESDADEDKDASCVPTADVDAAAVSDGDADSERECVSVSTMLLERVDCGDLFGFAVVADVFEPHREPEADADADSESRAVAAGLALESDGELCAVYEALSDGDGDIVVVRLAESVAEGGAVDVGAAVVVIFSDADELNETCGVALTLPVAE